MKLFKNKFFVICLCVAVVLAGVTSTFSLMGLPMLSRNILGTVTAPLRWCVTAVTNAAEGFGRYFTSIDTLQAENERLEAENAALREQLDSAALLEYENQRLKAYLNIKDDHPDFTMVEGMVISRESESYASVFTLNRGSLHGVKTGMAVMTEQGIVGSVKEVGLNWCKVTTVIETASSVGACVLRSGDAGIVSGDFSLRKNGYCKFSYVEGTADIEVGDTIVTSAMSGVYPADLVIGQVTSIGTDEYTRMTVATVLPAVDFSTLQWVMIVTGYEG